LRWVSYVAQVKEVPAGFPIGYGRTFIAPRPMRIAVIPQGYSDGYDRGLSSRGAVLIRKAACPIIGRVAMNMCVADVSHVPGVQVEDEVVLLGRQGGEEVSAERLAEAVGSINYEVVARVSPLLPRVVV
jgi:alanine racemase